MERKITGLKLQKRNRQRVNVYLDGEFAFGISKIVAAWLQVGHDLSEEKIERLLADDEREAAYQQALRYLSYRPRSEFEVSQYLNKKKIGKNIQNEVLERMRKNGMINDTQFSKAWIENRSELRPRSKRMLSYELKRRGIEYEIIEQELEEVDDEKLAYHAASKQERKYRNLSREDFRQKMLGHLSRKGFSYSVSSQIIDQVWEEHQNTNEYERRG